MSTNNTSILDSRVFRIGLFAVLAVVVLAGAAFLWGTGLRAVGPQAIAPAPSYNGLAGVAGIRALDSAAAARPEEAVSLLPAARYMGFAGVAAVRAADVSVVERPLLAGIAAVRAADASEALASRYGSSLGVSAVRAADASASYRSSLLGVAAVRAVDQLVRAASASSAGAQTQGLSNLELRRAESPTSASGMDPATLTSVRREPGVASGR